MKNILIILGLTLVFSGAFAIAEEGTFRSAMPALDSNNMKDYGNSSFDEEISGQEFEEGRGVTNISNVDVSDSVKNIKSKKRMRVNDRLAKSSLSIDEEIVGGEVRYSTKLSNGKKVRVKVMPDTASESALARLRMKDCSEESGCFIKLKEVGAGENTRLTYEVKAKKKSKVFGLFKANMNIRAEVSAETGEVLSSSKPWWAFLASEPEE